MSTFKINDQFIRLRSSDYSFIRNFFLAINAPWLAIYLFQRARSVGIMDVLIRGVHVIKNFNYQDFRKVASSVTKPKIKFLLKHNPKIYLKYFGQHLSLSFDIKTRANNLSYHYRLLNNCMNSNFMHQIVTNQILLWQEVKGDDRFTIHLSYPHGTDSEGDLCLIFRLNTTALFFLNFTFISGDILCKPSDSILIIGRLQGKSGVLDLIKFSTKNLEDVSPPTLLVAATVGISNSLGIKTIIGVRNSAQVCVGDRQHLRESSHFYDEYWKSIGARVLDGNFFEINLLAEDKPISMIKNNHRSRVKRRRQFKSEVVKQIEQNFVTNCLWTS